MSPIAAALITFGLLIISLSIHEAAHAWTSNRLGDPTAKNLGRITLNPLAHIDWIGTVLFPLLAYMSNVPLIGWAKPVPVDSRNLRAPRRDFAVVAAAGPASNVLQALAAAGILATLFEPSSMDTTARILRYFIFLNVSLAVFNLIPIPPLDGGNMLAGILPEQFARMFDQLRTMGFVLLYVLMFAGVFQRFVYPVTEAIYNVLVPIY